MQNLKTIFLILVISLSFRCSNNSDLLFDPSYWSSPYKGITITDKLGNKLKVDESDWCNYQVGFYAFLPAYPNPVDRDNENIRFVFYTSPDCRIKLLINDGDYKTVIILTDRVYSRGLYEIEWDLKDKSGLKVPGGIYRCYMYAPDFICHGDIWIK